MSFLIRKFTLAYEIKTIPEWGIYVVHDYNNISVQQ